MLPLHLLCSNPSVSGAAVQALCQRGRNPGAIYQVGLWRKTVGEWVVDVEVFSFDHRDKEAQSSQLH
jgi:hypothetical protein